MVLSPFLGFLFGIYLYNLTDMSSPILMTKLFAPPPRQKLVPRPRLIEKLSLGLEKPLTLISAPAGSGKTTLLSSWKVENRENLPVAWLTLDAGDNDPVRFFLYLAVAMDSLHAGITEETQLLLRSPQSETTEVIITSLINDVMHFSREFVMVLDDYHVITSQVVNGAIKLLVDHQPPQMHLVILTRADPPLALAKLRARGELVEIRAMDLRFSPEEEAVFLNKMMGLGLSGAEIQALDRRIEGWIAGFLLVAIALQTKLAEEGREGIQTFVETFSGSHHYIVEYLADEVLNQQSEIHAGFSDTDFDPGSVQW